MYETADLITAGVVCWLLGLGVGMVLERWHWQRIREQEK